MTTEDFRFLEPIAAAQPHPLVFATVSGAHLYGFASPDSDFDLRGVHLLPLETVIGLSGGRETIEVHEIRDGREIDLVTHDLAKFLRLLLRPNGYVLEQVLSPLVVYAGPAFAELQALARTCVTCRHVHHYRGFYHSQWRLFEKESPRRVKPLLYVYRVLLTGIHLMQTGEVEANLPRLLEATRDDGLPTRGVAELIAWKQSSAEQTTLDAAHFDQHAGACGRLLAELEHAAARSALPESTAAARALEDLLVRLRLAARSGAGSVGSAGSD